MVHTNKQTFFLTKNLKVLLVICLMIISVSYFLLLNSINQAEPRSQTQLTDANIKFVSASTEGRNPQKDFVYSVKDISPDQITLTGVKGELTLSNNTARIEVYNGQTQSSSRLLISELRLGETVTAEYVSDSLIRVYRMSQ